MARRSLLRRRPQHPGNNASGEGKAPRRRGCGWWLLRATVVVLALLGLGLALLRGALELPQLRAWITQQVSDRLEAATGLRLTAADWRLAPTSGELEVTRLELLSGPSPVVSAERVELEADLGSLLRGRPRILRLRLEQPHVDLRPAWPEQPASEGATGELPLDIVRLQIEDGSLAAATPAGVAGWVEGVRVERLSATGRLVAGSIELELPTATLVLDGPADSPLGRATAGGELTLSGRFTAPASGALTGSARLRGPGAELTLKVNAADRSAGPVDLDLDLGIDLARFLGQADAGRLQASGRVDLISRTGELTLHADRLPGELLAPWVGEEAMARLELADSQAAATLELSSQQTGTLSGTGSVDWQRRGQPLLSAELSLAEARLDPDREWQLDRLQGQVQVAAREAPVELLRPWLPAEQATAFEAVLDGTTVDLDAGFSLSPQVTPPLEGSVTLSWRRDGEPLLQANGRVEESAVDDEGALDLERLRALVEIEAADFPAERLLPLLPSTVTEAGLLDATRLVLNGSFRLTGRGIEPGTGAARLALKRDGETLAEAKASSVAGAPVALALEATLLPERSGHRRLKGDLLAPGWSELAASRLRDGRVELSMPDVPAAVAELEGLWPQLLDPELLQELDPWLLSAAVEAEAEVSGPLDRLTAELRATVSLAAGGRLRLEGHGEPLSFQGEAELEAEEVLLGGLPIEVEGVLSGRLTGTASGEGWDATTELRARDLEVGSARFDLVELAARATPEGMQIESLKATVDRATLVASGRLELAVPPTWADLDLELHHPDEGIDRLALELVLADGALSVQSSTFATRWGAGDLQIDAPLGTLFDLAGLEPELREQLAPAGARGGPISVSASVPRLDSETLAPLLGLEERPERVVGEDLHLTLTLTARDLAAASGALSVGTLELTTEEHRLVTEAPLRLRLEDRRLVLDPLPLLLDDESRMEVAATASLAPQWTPDPNALVEELSLDAKGTLDLAMLDPFLLGGVGSGTGTVAATLSGPLSQLEGSLTLEAPEGRVQYASPYVSRFDAPSVDLSFHAGGLVVIGGEARLNEGNVKVGGTYVEEDGTNLEVNFEAVRYRLDYGLSAALSGRLDLRLPPEDSTQRGLIAGEVTVDRGLARRDVNLERELFNRLLAPSDIQAASDVADIDLDLRVATREGVRVRNNLADLRAVWSPLTVRGTLAEPRIQGTVDVEPGGMLYAYGQALRVDRGTLTLSAIPGVEPRLELVATSSLEDPTLGRDGRSSLDPFARQQEAGAAPPPGTTLASGLAEYAADLLVTSVGAPLEATGITLRPVIIFNESEPEARLVVGRDLSENLALAISINLRQAERRTYLLQGQRLPGLPRMQAQVFTNEADNQGAALQQTLDFGGGPQEPLVRYVEIEVPDEIAVRPLRKAIGIDEKEPLPDGAIFDTELEVTEHLRRQGYFSPQVDVTELPDRRPNRVRLRVQVDPGPKTEVVFEGEQPGSRHRASIASLYRTDFYEQASREEMRAQTVRALRSGGFLDPQVEVTTAGGTEEAPAQVVVTASGGRRVELGSPTFTGVDAETAALLAERFTTPLSRVELAAGLPSADRQVLQTLRAAGYPRPQVVDRTISENGRRLDLEIETGPRQTLASARVSGVADEEARRLETLLPLEPGEPARAERIATATLLVEQDLRREGYADAFVQPRLAPREEGGSVVDLELAVTLGPQYHVSDVEVTGAKTTRPGWARSLTGVEAGDPLESSRLSEIRRRLYATGVFTSAAADYERLPGGDAVLRLDLEERARFTFAYGLRYESDEGGGVVVDFLDRNSFGRGIALGARGLVTEKTELARVYGGIPIGRRWVIEPFAEQRNEEDSGLLIDTNDLSLQFSRSFGRRTTGRVYGSYREQRFTEKDPDPFFPLDVTVTSPTLGLQYFYDRRTDPLSGQPGMFASVDLSGASSAIGSDFDYVRLFGQVNLYRPVARLGRRQLGWAQSYRIGFAESFDQILLRDLRFLAGGEFSVRGYPTESLGPVERLGDIERALGGDALLVINQELHLPIWGGVSGVAFFDIGNVWEEKRDFGSDLAKSLGLGARYASPIGLLRLDVAFPLDRREGDPAFKYYIGFGQVF